MNQGECTLTDGRQLHHAGIGHWYGLVTKAEDWRVAFDLDGSEAFWDGAPSAINEPCRRVLDDPLVLGSHGQRVTGLVEHRAGFAQKVDET